MENIEETRFEVVKTMLQEFPELKERVLEYLSEQTAEEDKELVELMNKQGYSNKVVSNVLKIY